MARAGGSFYGLDLSTGSRLNSNGSRLLARCDPVVVASAVDYDAVSEAL
jgi:hypothetical protein